MMRLSLSSILDRKRRLHIERNPISDEFAKRATRRAYFKASNHPLTWCAKIGKYASAAAVAVVGIQWYVWLRFGIWPPASPIAIWAYTQPIPPMDFSLSTWDLVENWESHYIQNLDESIGWVGVSIAFNWLLSQHSSIYGLLLGVIALLAIDELEHIRGYRATLDTPENEDLTISQLRDIEQRSRKDSTLLLALKLLGWLSALLLYCLACIHFFFPL